MSEAKYIPRFLLEAGWNDGEYAGSLSADYGIANSHLGRLTTALELPRQESDYLPTWKSQRKSTTFDTA